MKRISNSVLISILLLALSHNSQAILITDMFQDMPGLKTVDFSQFNSTTYSGGPVEIGGLVEESITWTTTHPDEGSLIGAGFYGLGSNGWWDEGKTFVGLNIGLEHEAYMLFEFNEGCVSAVGGFINYSPGVGFDVLVEVLDVNREVLESYNINELAPILTSGLNQGAFRGIVRQTNDIAAFRVSNSYVVLDNLTFTSIPEPCTLSLLALGGLFLRKRKP